ncbi:MAG: adenosylmethionine--8-amino-7-oxononanoate transaminase [Desulfovibrionaceae bacterium]
MTAPGALCCVTGTDTDVGKTVVTAGLLRALAATGLRAQAIKPVQTGCPAAAQGEPAAPDVAVYAEAAPTATALALHTLRTPCSPHLAAALDGRKLTAAALADGVRRHAAQAALTLVEGAGGVLAPLNERETMRDLFAALAAPVILVTTNRLGAINHTLLSLEALRARGLHVAGVVITEPAAPAPDEESQRIRRDTVAAIARLGGLPVLARIPYCPDLASDRAPVRTGAWEHIARQLAPAAQALAADCAGDATPDAPDALLTFDREHVWHPYTSATKPLRAWEAVATRGARITLRNGASLVDGMASWWSAIHGYNHPRLLRALHGQAARMPHVMFGGLTHAPAVDLARRLLSLAPPRLAGGRVFFADSGSVAVEVALKMAVQYQHATGHPERTVCLTPRGGYHGDTLGAMSVCDPVNGMHGLFAGILPRQVFTARPACPFHAPYDPGPARELEAALERHGAATAAVVLEPIVQGAGGMWFYHPDYLKRVRELCDAHGALLILDEIATGFGRTGKMFAAEWAGVSPDIMCVGKALTGGVMSLAATLATREVAHGVSRGGGVLMHGPTFMANPLACAVACASLDELAASPWRERIGRMESAMAQGLAPCRHMDGVADVRVLGGIGVVAMRRPVHVEKLQEFFVRECGVWIRPFGRLIYIMPPYVATGEEIAALVRSIATAIEEKKWE